MYEVDLTKVEIEQLISLLAPLQEISVKTQIQSEAYGFRYLQKIIKERCLGCLNVKKPLKHFQKGQPDFTTLSPRVTETRRLLVEAIDIKFFSRYFRKEDKGVDLRQAFMLEAQHLLHPAFRNLKLVYTVMAELVESESVALGAAWWKRKKKTARKQAMQSGNSRGKGSNAPIDQDMYKRFLQKAKSDFLKQVYEKVETKVKQNIIDTIMRGDRGDVASTRTVETKRSRVRSQFMEYLQAQDNVRAFSDVRLCLNVAKWIKEVGIYKYGLVALAMPAFFGIPTSSSGIELDFYFNSLLLTKQRMSMRGEVAEMLHISMLFKILIVIT